jgi:hypothetical protein
MFAGLYESAFHFNLVDSGIRCDEEVISGVTSTGARLVLNSAIAYRF